MIALLLRRGSRSLKVLEIQKKLRKLGYSVKPDGIFGEETERAVILFQLEHGLQADGLVGARTLDYLETIEKRRKRWVIEEFHNFGSGEIFWRKTDQGIEIKDEGYVRWHKNKSSRQIKAVVRAYLSTVTRESERFGIPREYLLSTILVESGGNPFAYRYEPRLDQASLGVMQVLEKTAQGLGIDDPERLFEPEVCIHYGAKLMKEQSKFTLLDPVLVAVAYNAGRVAPGSNRWNLRMFDDYAGKWVRFYNDVMELLREVGE